MDIYRKSTPEKKNLTGGWSQIDSGDLAVESRRGPSSAVYGYKRKY